MYLFKTSNVLYNNIDGVVFQLAFATCNFAGNCLNIKLIVDVLIMLEWILVSYYGLGLRPYIGNVKYSCLTLILFNQFGRQFR